MCFEFGYREPWEAQVPVHVGDIVGDGVIEDVIVGLANTLGDTVALAVVLPDAVAVTLAVIEADAATLADAVALALTDGLHVALPDEL